MLQNLTREKKSTFPSSCAIIEDDNCVTLEQGGSKMQQPDETFELTNCPDPKCYICNMHKGGYPSVSQIEDGRIKLNPYHKKKFIEGLGAILELIERAA